MTLGTPKNETDTSKPSLEKKKEKDHTPTKVVIRRLPPSLTPEDFVQQVSPLPEYDFFYFVRADMSLGQNAFTRAYINFLVPDDIFNFRDKFDGYVFLDSKVSLMHFFPGGEYPAIVEFAPFQKVPKKKPKKVDAKNGIIEQDSDYKKFLENLSKPVEVTPVSLDAMVVEVETKETNLAKAGSSRVSTPLLEYLRKRREERKLNIAKLKEERRRGGIRDGDRKRPGNDELDRRKSMEKDRLRDRDRDRHSNRDRDRIRDRDRFRDRRREKDPPPRSERIKDEKDGEERKWLKDAEGTPKMLLRNTDRDNVPYDTGGADKPTPVLEREKRDDDKESLQERLSETDIGKGFRDRRSEDTRGKRGGYGKWSEERRREDDRDRHRGSRNRGYEDDRDRGRSYKDGARSYWEETDRRQHDREKMRDKADRYGDRGSYKSRDGYGGGSGYRDKYREDRGGSGRSRGYIDKDDGRGSGDRDRDDRKAGGDREKEERRGDSVRDKEDRRAGDRDDRRDDRKTGAGDGWKKKESDPKRFEKSVDKKPEPVKTKPSDDGKKETTTTVSKEALMFDSNKEDKVKDEENMPLKGAEPSDYKERQQPNRIRGGDDQSQRSTPDTSPPCHSREENDDGRGDNTEGEDKKRKKKERPERQIYIPRKALERQRQGSPQIADGSKDKSKEPS
ncbi:hypothetical protein Btru_039403 [Bulinus truncatus]|nr:hypothetical protein Btru_039403 [Bulinus truncatus]